MCSGDQAGVAGGIATDLADVAGMIRNKALVTLDDILRIVREDYPEMTPEELQKHLDDLIDDASIIDALVACPRPSRARDRVM